MFKAINWIHSVSSVALGRTTTTSINKNHTLVSGSEGQTNLVVVHPANPDIIYWSNEPGESAPCYRKQVVQGGDLLTITKEEFYTVADL